MSANKKRIPTRCTSCKYHEVLPDPDPLDSFCKDDVKIVCTRTRRKRNTIAVAVRPYNTGRESTRPSWCPLQEDA